MIRGLKQKNLQVNEDGFSLLELVVAVGILLILTVGGLLAYNGITDNARKAAVDKAASEVLTGAIAYDTDTNPGQDYEDAVKEWNDSSKKDKNNNASIVVDAIKNSDGEICAEARGYGYTSNKGAGDCVNGLPVVEEPSPTIPAITLSQGCQFQPGILGLGSNIRIYWTLPEGYTLDDVRIEASTSGLGSTTAPLTGLNLKTATIQQTDGTYMTNVPANLLGGLMGLGSELEIALFIVDGSGKSAPASVASNAGLIAGVGGSCRNL